MHSVLKERLWRKLESLPEERLYQVLDYIEFLESRYAERPAPPPGGLQKFAERLEDGMRARRVAPKVMLGTMRVMGAAARVVDGVTATGRQLLTPPPPRTDEPRPATRAASTAGEATPRGTAGGATPAAAAPTTDAQRGAGQERIQREEHQTNGKADG